jgi:phosphoribosylanthranilate isomerase
MFVKICANTNLEDALLAAQLGADAVGFVLAKGKRQVTSEQVCEITRSLPPTVEKIGVFDLDDPYGIEHYVACSGLTGAQLHRAYDPELVRLLSEEFGGELKIIQTVAYELDPPDRTAADARFEVALKQVFADPRIWATLIDAKKSGMSGGLGLAFDWKHVAALLTSAAATSPQPPRILLAGGLTPANVAQAITAFSPWGVDVASGVESSPGHKDPAKLRAFLDAARGKAVSRREDVS